MTTALGMDGNSWFIMLIAPCVCMYVCMYVGMYVCMYVNCYWIQTPAFAAFAPWCEYKPMDLSFNSRSWTITAHDWRTKCCHVAQAIPSWA